MKKSALILFSLLLGLPCFAQQTNECNADMLANNPGSVIQKEYENISRIRNLSILTVHITDITHNKKLSALDLEYAYNGENAATFAVLLDPIEVDSLLSFLQNLQKNMVNAGAPKNYTEYSFISKSGMQAGCYWSGKEWKIYVKINVKENKSDVEFNNDEFTAFISFLKQARAKM